jgi:SAM-dependent methyltransferase
MYEAKKTNEVRGPHFAAMYLQGRVIDIGAGNDLVCSWAERFDIEDGDANLIARYRQPGVYDAVHSSHCLEHMHDPKKALSQWWSLVKPGGYLVLVVPDEDLYEQGMWPSIFNPDHKATFRLDRAASWSPVSCDIEQAILELPKARLISAEIHDFAYDYHLQMRSPGERVRRVRGMWKLAKYSSKMPFGWVFMKWTRKLLFRCGVAIDQTLGEALAQIQVVARKEAE